MSVATTSMPETRLKRRLRFTIYHGFAVSLALHSALGMPFVMHILAEPPDEPPTLVIELQGVVADTQIDQKVLQETKGAAKQEEVKEEPKPPVQPEQPAAPSDTQPIDTAAEDQDAPPVPPPPTPEQTKAQDEPTQAVRKPAEAKSGNPGANNVTGAEEQQVAQTIKADPEEADELRDYVRSLTKQVRAHVIVSDEARQAGLKGSAYVSFTILPSGQIRPESLKITVSSGQPQLDASALKTIRASLPFPPPPHEITVGVPVDFGRKP